MEVVSFHRVDVCAVAEWVGKKRQVWAPSESGNWELRSECCLQVPRISESCWVDSKQFMLIGLYACLALYAHLLRIQHVYFGFRDSVSDMI